MSDPVLVQAGTTQFFVEVAEGDHVSTVGIDQVPGFDGVREAIAAIADELTRAWERARPDEATVTFGLKIAAKSGKLTGLLVEGSGEASLTVSLKWAS